MAVFGTPRPAPDDALRALRCVGDMIAIVERWNSERTAAGEAPIRIGIGVHYGPVVTGDMGDERRLEYAVIGDTVNVAARIEKMTREKGVLALVTGDAMDAARGAADPGVTPGAFRPAGTAAVRGRAEPVTLWTPDPSAPGAMRV